VAWHRQAQRSAINVVWTGLTVTVAGHLLRLERDNATKIARVVSEHLLGHGADGTAAEAVRMAAELLAGRAQRVLGAGWKVTPLDAEG